LSSKWALSTDSINLRRNRNVFSFGDTEYIVFSVDVYRDLPKEQLWETYSLVAQYLINQLDEFKLCIECRGLYLDKRSLPFEHMICTHCLFDRVFEMEDANCAICKESFKCEEQTYAMTCSHVFHSRCILTNFILSKKRDCPLCREVDSD